MKGVVFNLLETFIVEGWGEDKYDEIMAQCPLHTKEPFVGPRTYPDSDLMTIAGKTAADLGLPLDAALQAFGEFCFPHLQSKVSELVSVHDRLEDFLASVHSVVHVEVRKLMPQAVTPSFEVLPLEDGRTRMVYRSDRKLCAFAVGLIIGAGKHFKQGVEVEHSRCMHDGADSCFLDLSIADGDQAAA